MSNCERTINGLKVGTMGVTGIKVSTTRLNIKSMDVAKSRFNFIKKSIMELCIDLPDVQRIALGLIKCLERPHKDVRIDLMKDKAIKLYSEDIVQDTLYYALQMPLLETEYEDALKTAMADMKEQLNNNAEEIDWIELETPFFTLIKAFYATLLQKYYSPVQVESYFKEGLNDDEEGEQFIEIEDTQALKELENKERETIVVYWNGEPVEVFKDDYDMLKARETEKLHVVMSQGNKVYSEREARKRQKELVAARARKDYKGTKKFQKICQFIEVLRNEETN